MEVKGVNGQIELHNDRVIIKRKGVMSKLTQGLKGEKSILVSRISSVQFKEATSFTNGYIQFGFSGGEESKSGLFDATKDENTVMFRKSQQREFERLRDKIDQLIGSANTPSQTPKTKNSTSNLDELEKLSHLKEKGIITEEEFKKKKKQLLGI